jgi:hypothetical protein
MGHAARLECLFELIVFHNDVKIERMPTFLCSQLVRLHASEASYGSILFFKALFARTFEAMFPESGLTWKEKVIRTLDIKKQMVKDAASGRKVGLHPHHDLMERWLVVLCVCLYL